MKSMFPHAFVLAFFAAALSTSEVRAEAPGVFQVQAGQSNIAYTINHKLHTVIGTSKQVEGKAALRPDGTIQLMVRAPIKSFDSQNSGRDEHMQETLETSAFPMVTFKGVGKITPPTQFPATVTVPVRGELEFHGRTRPETVTVQVVFDSEKHLRASGAFDVSLDKYEVERPSLMLMKIDDACHLALDLDLKRNE